MSRWWVKSSSDDITVSNYYCKSTPDQTCYTPSVSPLCRCVSVSPNLVGLSWALIVFIIEPEKPVFAPFLLLASLNFGVSNNLWPVSLLFPTSIEGQDQHYKKSLESFTAIRKLPLAVPRILLSTFISTTEEGFWYASSLSPSWEVS